MSEFGLGLYAMPAYMEALMPCKPDDIKFPKYDLPQNFGGFEYRETAARIIWYSKSLGTNTWWGVSERVLTTTMYQEIALKRHADEVKIANEKEKWRVEGLSLRLVFMNALSLLINREMLPKEKPNLNEVPKYEQVSSWIFHFGPKFVLNAVDEMVKMGYLVKFKYQSEYVIFPTPKLAAKAMEPTWPNV